jgi:hypothetical protein
MLGALVWGSGQLATAQDSTPTAPDSFELAPGVVADSFVFVEGREEPLLYTLHFDPDVVYAVEPGSNLELGYLEAGTLTMTLEAPVTIAQVGDTASAGEVIDAGTEVTLSVGQYFVLQPGVSGEIRNDGDEVATLSVAGVLLDGMATPGATPAG